MVDDSKVCRVTVRDDEADMIVGIRTFFGANVRERAEEYARQCRDPKQAVSATVRDVKA